MVLFQEYLEELRIRADGFHKIITGWTAAELKETIICGWELLYKNIKKCTRLHLFYGNTPQLIIIITIIKTHQKDKSM